MAKKEKVTYIDDGRTVADMSALESSGGLRRRNPYTPRPKFKEVWKTYWGAVRMMLVPMAVVVAAMAVIYLIMLLAFWLM